MPDHFSDSVLPPGKVPPDGLARLLALPRPTCEQRLLPPGLGEDAAGLQVGALGIEGRPPAWRVSATS